MFPRRQRLTRDTFSPTLLAHSRRVSSQNLSVLVPNEGVHGYAVVISKKIARLSVTRHRLKRRILAVLREQKLPQALIVFPKISALKLPPPALRSEIREVLSKIAPRP